MYRNHKSSSAFGFSALRPTLTVGVLLALAVLAQVRSRPSGFGHQQAKPSFREGQVSGTRLTYTANSIADPANTDQHSKCQSEPAQDGMSQDGASSKRIEPDDALIRSAMGLASWKESEVTLTVDASFPRLPGAIAALRAAVDTWTRTARELPSVKLRLADDHFLEVGDEASRAEHRLYLAPDGDERTNGALAVTVTTVDVDRASILDGDIVVDGSHWYPDLEPSPRDESAFPVWYDLQSVLTHELGHWLGLPEDYCNSEATMYAYTRPGETNKRDLDQADIVVAQVAYWQAANPSGEVGCHLTKPGANSALGLLSYVAAFALWMCARRPGRASARNGRGRQRCRE